MAYPKAASGGRRPTEPCPVARDGVPCPRRHNPDYLMCRPCWSRVPRDLQRAVYAAVRDYRARSITLAELRAVQADAIEVASRPMGEKART